MRFAFSSSVSNTLNTAFFLLMVAAQMNCRSIDRLFCPRSRFLDGGDAGEGADPAMGDALADAGGSCMKSTWRVMSVLSRSSLPYCVREGRMKRHTDSRCSAQLLRSVSRIDVSRP